eukprot:scaffold93674_cov80-Cyclotella_meneghiniana.AAC.2
MVRKSARKKPTSQRESNSSTEAVDKQAITQQASKRTKGTVKSILSHTKGATARLGPETLGPENDGWGPEQSRPLHNTLFSRGPPRKRREASGIGKKQVPTDGEAPSLYHSFLDLRDHTDVGSWCTSKLTLNVPTNALLGNTQYCPSNTAIANIRSAADRELEGGRFQG